MRGPADLSDELRLRLARGLETGAWNGRLAELASRAWGEVAARAIVRPLVWPASKRLVAIGGATLGGSGKTPLAIASARALASHGARVALVAHSYRAKPREAHVVRPEHAVRDALARVGDEALVAARSLGDDVSVVVAPTRQRAMDLACARADVVVLDGVLQTTPRRASLSLLALDGDAPWGAGRVVPRGDLRATPEALRRASDQAVFVSDAPQGSGRLSAHIRSLGAHHAGALQSWAALSLLHVGVFTALARPARLLAHLARRDLRPRHVVSLADHARPAPSALARRLAALPVDLWLASSKCALVLEAAGVAHAVLDYTLVPDRELAHILAILAEGRSTRMTTDTLTLLDVAPYSGSARYLPAIWAR